MLISNARARRMLAMQMYVDVATGEFVARSGRGHSADDEVATAAKTLYEAILAGSADVEMPMRTDIEDMTVTEFMQAFIEDMDEPKKMITDKQQIMWDLAFEHGRAAKISSDGEYLADKMREKGLILEDVGNACGVSKSCVDNWVQDLRPIPRKHKETIATTFGILL